MFSSIELDRLLLAQTPRPLTETEASAVFFSAPRLLRDFGAPSSMFLLFRDNQFIFELIGETGNEDTTVVVCNGTTATDVIGYSNTSGLFISSTPTAPNTFHFVHVQSDTNTEVPLAEAPKLLEQLSRFPEFANQQRNMALLQTLAAYSVTFKYAAGIVESFQRSQNMQSTPLTAENKDFLVAVIQRAQQNAYLLERILHLTPALRFSEYSALLKIPTTNQPTATARL